MKAECMDEYSYFWNWPYSAVKRMGLVLVFLFLALAMTSQLTAQVNTSEFRVDVTSDNLTTCATGSNNGQATVNILAKANTATDFIISFDLPTGVDYIPGSAVIIGQTGSGDFVLAEADVSNLNQPSFSIQRPGNTPWGTNDTVQFTLGKTAGCDAVQYNYNGGLFKDAHTISFNDANGPHTYSDHEMTVNGYVLLSPYISILPIDRVVLNGLNTSIPRNVSIKNSGNGALQSFHHYVTVPSELRNDYQLTFNGTPLTPEAIINGGSTYVYLIDFASAPFLGQVGDGDSLFENETLSLTENVNANACFDDRDIVHSSNWGCSATDVCQQSETTIGQVHMDQPISSLSVTLDNKRPGDLGGATTYNHTITNNGTTIAYNVNINVGFNWDEVYSTQGYNTLWGEDYKGGRTLDNFRFQGGSSVTPQRWPSDEDPGTGLGSHYLPSNFFTSDPDGPGGLADLDGDGYFDDLPVGASTEILFDYSVSLQNRICDPWTYELLSFDQLRLESWAVNPCGQSSDTQRSEVTRDEIAAPGIFDWANPKLYDQDANDGSPFSLAFTDKISFNFETPTCNGQPLVSNDPSTIYTASITVPNGMSLIPTGDSRYVQAGNTITFTESNLLPYMVTSSRFAIPVDFQLQVDCSTYSGPRDLNIPYLTHYSSDCFDRDLHCGNFELAVHCNTVCNGPVTQSFDASRSTAGWTNSDMATRVTLDPNVHATKFYMANDEMTITSSAYMQNFTANNLYLDIHYITDSEGSSSQDNIAFVEGEITINDLSNPAGPQTTTITVPPAVTSINDNNHRAVFDLSGYTSIISPSYQYGEGSEADEISVRLVFKFKDDFAQPAFLYRFSTFEANFFSYDVSGNQISCDSYSDWAYYTRPFIGVDGWSNNQVTGCNTAQIVAGIEMRAGMGDRFPNEFRPPAIFQEAKIEIPQGMVFQNYVSSYGFPNIQPANEAPDSDNGGLQYSVSGNIVTVTPGPNLNGIDFGGNHFPWVGIDVIPTSATPPTVDYSLEMTFTDYAYSDYPVSRTQNRTLTFTYNNLEYYIEQPQSLIKGYKETASFTALVSNGIVQGTDYNWLRVDPDPGFTLTAAYLVDGSTETPLNIVSEGPLSFVEYGVMEEWIDNQKEIRFEGTFDSCSPMDIRVSQNYDCIGYPTTYTGLAYFSEKTYTLNPVPSAIQLNVLSQPVGTVDTCSDYEVVLEARNAGEGDFIDPSLSFTVPGDVSSLNITDIAVEYPRSSGNIESLTPTINGNTVTINLLEHSAINTDRSIHGSISANTIDDQIAILRLTLNPQCNFRSNTGTTYTINGNNPCGSPALGDGSRVSTNPIIITGAEPPYTANSTVTVPDMAGCTAQTVSVSTSIIDGTTGNTDFTRIRLPQGFTMVANSLSYSGNQVSLISTSVQSGIETIELQFAAGVTGSGAFRYTFDIVADAAVCANDYGIDLETYVTNDNLNCGPTSCGITETVTGGAQTSFGLTKGALMQSSFTPTAEYSLVNGVAHYTIAIGVENTGGVDLPVGSTYEVYCADGAGNPVGNSLHTGSLTQAIPVGTSIQEGFSFASNTFCGNGAPILVRFVPSANNCFCQALDIQIATVENNQYADLSLDKTVSNRRPAVGERIIFYLLLENQGPNEATNVGIEDVVPQGYAVDATTISNGGSLNADTITWNLAQLPVGSITLSYEVIVAAPTGTLGEYVNIAQVTQSDQNDPDSRPNNHDTAPDEDDSDSVTDVSIPTSDIDIHKTVLGNNAPRVGDVLNFSITVNNTGPDVATGIVIQDVVPIGYSLNPASVAANGTISGTTITWNIATLPIGTTTLDYQATVNPSTGTLGEYTNVAQVTESDQFDPDSTPGNYDPSRPLEDDESSYTLPTPETDIAVNKTVDPNTAKIGDRVRFTIAVTNLGSIEATGIQIDELLPDGYGLIASQASSGTYDPTTGLWDIPALAAQEAVTLTLEVTVLDGTNYTNVATIIGLDQLDTNPGNDTSEATVVLENDNCLLVYNEFSPNNDGRNEFFHIECIEQYPNNHVEVFNRWGVKVFEAYGYKNDWDGTSQARATINTSDRLPVGTYYYILDLGEPNSTPNTGWLYITR